MGNATIEVVLMAPREPQPIGWPVAIDITVINRSTADIWLPGVLDGSEAGIRYPFYLPEITREGTVVARPEPPEDPLFTPLRTLDFRRLTPGEDFNPTSGKYHPLTTFSSYAPDRPGHYRYTLTLSTESPLPENWLSSFGQEDTLTEVMKLISLVPRLTVRSAPLDVTVG
ncbi:hypothetical protein [Streptosporangium carneum]|uniref:Uncharacterized protein n=1 Tax=Streptosporangium carneum TaxID=47481 RepID=A0A9W6MAT5_9ACTN|nr:hypothetical protein [Streptosporangium carneum]GLK07644.1 hypothetical protein GCM10017600_10490 [Streptosporangium carneum]